MKTLKHIYNKLIFALCISAVLLTFSCEDDFLEEIPRSFLSPEITFVTTEGFRAGLTGVYSMTRALFVPDAPGTAWSDRDDLMSLNYGTDIGWYWDKKNFFGDYSIINPSTNYPSRLWNLLYIIIKDANIIITRAENENVEWSNPTDKDEVLAEARFYRAFAYRYLVYHYGGVPIIEGEIKGVKLDFVRATKEQVLDFMIADLEFASQNLPVENPNDGHVVKAAADHLLAETYISTGDYGLAIQAASDVINDSQYALMTDRYGSYSGDPGGDVYWDLFRYGNQNDPTNTEVIWTAQIEFNLPGGAGSFARTERAWGPFMDPVRTPDGLQAILKDEYWGRPVGFIRPSIYLDSTIWESDFNNDIRNSSYNVQREFIINNPASAHFGEVIVPTEAQKVRNVFVYYKKATMVVHPQGYDTGGRTYNDIYIFRLAETYLLRAEAHLKNNDPQSAANDINVVRGRANATPVDPGDVDMHYLLDERARELVIEEPRQLTLRRVGMLGERIQMYNPISGPSFTAGRDELLPIPQGEIDANTGAELTQNPGYDE